MRREKEYIDELDLLILIDGLQEKLTSWSLTKKYYNLFGNHKNNNYEMKKIDSYFNFKLKRLAKLNLLKKVKEGRKIKYVANENNVMLGYVRIIFEGEKKIVEIPIENGLLIKTKNNYIIYAVKK